MTFGTTCTIFRVFLLNTSTPLLLTESKQKGKTGELHFEALQYSKKWIHDDGDQTIDEIRESVVATGYETTRSRILNEKIADITRRYVAM